MGTLILIRHGQSVWNAENRFTGWVNVPLSEQGITEAKDAGARLAAEGITVDIAFTSELQRAINTGRFVLEALGQGDLTQIEAWQLNERFYGALTGRDKDQTREEFGEEQVHIWRRSYDIPPPAGESLADTSRRTIPYFTETIIPATEAHDVVMVAAHGNSLRAILKVLDDVSDEEIPGIEIATGVPYVYEVADGRAVDKRILTG
ncbi:2,3-diphosphoglycerate-dependent phosphoglycerate mutase [Euzebya sp.]|uniref:2,3-bisphosphoglycerate-dependent phosphoglycerate mutase n=1 Tax=Euzebya sp. TaxID=1971409 RepID=UPI0035189FA0